MVIIVCCIFIISVFVSVLVYLYLRISGFMCVSCLCWQDRRHLDSVFKKIAMRAIGPMSRLAKTLLS